MGLGINSKERFEAYRSLFITELAQQDIHEIRQAVLFSVPLGDNRFKEEIERVLNVKVGQAKRGRPRIDEEAAIYYI
jgi:putative transposase